MKRNIHYEQQIAYLRLICFKYKKNEQRLLQKDGKLLVPDNPDRTFILRVME